MAKMTPPEILTTKSGRKLAIYYRTAGQYFTSYAELRSGKIVVASTQDRPYRFTGAVRTDALTLAESL